MPLQWAGPSPGGSSCSEPRPSSSRILLNIDITWMRHSQHLLTESARFKPVTCSLHRYLWHSSTWRRDKHALKWPTHAVKCFGKNTEHSKFILMNVSGTDIARVLSFHKKRNINCRVSASMQGQEWLSHIDAMHSQFDLLLCLRGYIHFSYLHTRARLFG